MRKAGRKEMILIEPILSYITAFLARWARLVLFWGFAPFELKLPFH
jgi:hypothetical protein